MKAASVTSIPKPKATHGVRAEVSPKAARWLVLSGSFIIVFGMYFTFVRPWTQTWGTTRYERTMPMPGDQFVTDGSQDTHAITINAPSPLAWRWLAQLGQDRGGFYSYDLLENMVGCRMPTKDYLRPEKESWWAGDKLWMYPASYNIAVSGAPLETYQPGGALGFATTKNRLDDSSWTFFLQPIDAYRTRFYVRSKSPADQTLGSFLFNRFIFEPAHFVMEKRMMIGIKQLSEGGSRGRLWNNVQILLWTLTFALWIASIVFVLRRANWLKPLAGFFAASAVFQFLTFGQPPVWIGALLFAAVCWILWKPRRAIAPPVNA